MYNYYIPYICTGSIYTRYFISTFNCSYVIVKLFYAILVVIHAW